MLQSVKNIYNLGVKEILSLCRDRLMVILILYSFSLAVITSSKAQPDSINHASIAVVDEDRSPLSLALTDAFMPPMFIPAKHISRHEIDPAMDRGKYTFVIVFPPDFQRDVLAGKRPEIQVNVDATRMTQAFNGSGYIQQILTQEIQKYLKHKIAKDAASYVVRNRFNPNLTQSWFSAIVQLVNNVTMLAIILTGAALIRERENGTLEHLLVMPVTAFEIMMSKIWSMMLVVLAATAGSLYFVVEMYLKIPVEGSVPLFLAGVALHLFAVTSLGIFLACLARNMPQLGMLLILVFLPMQMLSGGNTPRESMPVWVQRIMLAAPTTHFVSFSQSILFRGAGIEVVWKPFLMLFLIGCTLFVISLRSFRKSL